MFERPNISIICCYCLVGTQRQLFSEFDYFNQYLDCNYPFPIDLTPNGIPIDAVLNSLTARLSRLEKVLVWKISMN